MAVGATCATAVHGRHVSGPTTAAHTRRRPPGLPAGGARGAALAHQRGLARGLGGLSHPPASTTGPRAAGGSKGGAASPRQTPMYAHWVGCLLTPNGPVRGQDPERPSSACSKALLLGNLCPFIRAHPLVAPPVQKFDCSGTPGRSADKSADKSNGVRESHRDRSTDAQVPPRHVQTRLTQRGVLRSGS